MLNTAGPIANETDKKENKHAHPRDPAREVIETIVFVVVLVLLLKLFVTEAFVIPTGSMAETLYGYQKVVKCPQCGHEFPVNSHDEVEGRQDNGKKMRLYGYTCPNCRYQGTIDEIKPPPNNGSGDRVLVLKPLYHVREPHRGEVVVFKWPEKPQDKFVAQNYIKRAMGFGGETIAIYRGELLATTSLSYPEDAVDERGQPLYPRPNSPLDLWKPQYMYSTADTHRHPNPRAVELFERSRDAGFKRGIGGFEIIRKGEDQLLADRRMVWDNDQQSEEFAKLAKQVKIPDEKGRERIWWTRWFVPSDSEGGWTTNDTSRPVVFGHDRPTLDWIRYRHLKMPWKLKTDQEGNPPTDFETLARQQPSFIDNFLGYNTGRDQDPQTGRLEAPKDQDGSHQFWVGDLILQCKATFSAGSEVVLELSKGVNRFQARFTEGKVTLARIGRGSQEFGSPSRPCKIGPGTHELRFANVDCRLWVWVDGKRIDFGDEGDYLPIEPIASDGADPEGWVKANDIDAPASIGASGKVTIQNIKLERDIYYTYQPRAMNDFARPDIYYVQPGHYLCLGDNSAQSSDSRKWGLVPERLMLGKAVFVFFPVNRIGLIK